MLAYDATRQQTVLFGGYFDSAGSFHLNDTWTWDGAQWTTQASSPPPPRYLHAMAFDSIRNETVLFSGYGGAFPYDTLGDTWIWNGTRWMQRTGTQPPGRISSAMAFDVARGKVVLFGGSDIADTWTWDGAGWSAQSPALSPPGRSGHALAFDAERAVCVLFGGASGGTPRNDTWIWNGTTWTPLAPTHAPSARMQHAMAYDAARKEVVLFGGAGGGVNRNDTWVWNGLDWAQRSPLRPPLARYNHSLAYDARNGQTMLFGGTVYFATYGDTWVWDGAEWALRAPPTAPTARYGHAAAYDAARGQTVLFGGYGGGYASDTWLHVTLGGTCTTDGDCADAFCTDGVCCNTRSCGTCATCAGTSPGRCAPVTNEEDPDTCAARDNKSCNRFGDCKIALGFPATTAAQCASGFLVDGVCCQTVTCAPCLTCDVAKKERAEFPGQCSAARATTDPHDDCSDVGATSCQGNGACDGSGRCQLYKAGTSCGLSTCNGNRAAGQLCSGAGACTNDPNGVECAPFLCRDGSCLAVCRSDADCVSTHRCDRERCVTKESASCDGDHTVVAPDGKRTDCGLYRCAGETCKNRCASKSDCVGDAECKFDGTCASFAQVSTESDGCSAANPRGGCCLALPSGVLLFLAAVQRKKRARPA